MEHRWSKFSLIFYSLLKYSTWLETLFSIKDIAWITTLFKTYMDICRLLLYCLRDIRSFFCYVRSWSWIQKNLVMTMNLTFLTISWHSLCLYMIITLPCINLYLAFLVIILSIIITLLEFGLLLWLIKAAMYNVEKN